MQFTRSLSLSELSGLADALSSGRLRPRYTDLAVRSIVSSEHATETATALNNLSSRGVPGEGLAMMIRTIAEDRRATVPLDHSIDLVTTGPETAIASNRDTSVVVRELFAMAKTSVLVVGYAVHQGRRVFSALADRMRTRSELAVGMLLDIQRPRGDTSLESEVVRRFASRFVEQEWPHGCQLPKLYYYPASLERDVTKRAALHAKCVVIDEEVAFVSSANFTEAAQVRNIEVGVLVRSQGLARHLARHIRALIADRYVVPLDLPPGASIVASKPRPDDY